MMSTTVRRKLPVVAFSGTVDRCGSLYAGHYQREIAGFFSQEFGAYRYSAPFVRKCHDAMKSDAPRAFAFFGGATKSSLLSMQEHTLLLLHEEELYHRNLTKKMPHCSLVSVVGPDARRASVLLGENWDWNTAYFPWSSFNRFAVRGAPEFVSLSYPGLPACAGLNANGLALMWTGSGYFPPVLPKTGVPTYALVFETLLQPNVPAAVKYLQGVRNAGAFIFALGDREGNHAVVEAVPGKVFVEYSFGDHRANIFELPDAIRAAKQKLPGESRCHSLLRKKTFNRTYPKLASAPSVKGVATLLSQKNILIERGFSHATLVQLIADCRKGELHVRQWRETPDVWSSVRV